MKIRPTWKELTLAVLVVVACLTFAIGFRQSAARHAIFALGSVPIEVPADTAVTAAPRVRASDYAPLAARLFFGAESGRVDDSLVEEAASLSPYRDPLPVLYGIADLGAGPSALLAAVPARRAEWVSPGEIGEDRLVFTRGGSRFEATPTELRVAGGRRSSSAATGRGVRSQAPRPVSRPAPVPRAQPSRNGYRIGTEFRPGRFTADAQDGAVDGTVYQGHVRRVRSTPFGEQHWWEKTGP